MKTLIDTKQIENYLFGKFKTTSRLVFEARLLIDPVLSVNVEWQRKLYSIIRASGRKKMKSEIELIHSRLFSDPEKQIFQQTVYQLFLKK